MWQGCERITTVSDTDHCFNEPSTRKLMDAWVVGWHLLGAEVRGFPRSQLCNLLLGLRSRREAQPDIFKSRTDSSEGRQSRL